MKIVSNFGFIIRPRHKEDENEQKIYPELDLVIRSGNQAGDISGELVIKGASVINIKTADSIIQVNPEGNVEITPVNSECLIYDADAHSISDGYFDVE